MDKLPQITIGGKDGNRNAEKLKGKPIPDSISCTISRSLAPSHKFYAHQINMCRNKMYNGPNIKEICDRLVNCTERKSLRGKYVVALVQNESPLNQQGTLEGFFCEAAPLGFPPNARRIIQTDRVTPFIHKCC